MRGESEHRLRKFVYRWYVERFNGNIRRGNLKDSRTELVSVRYIMIEKE
jgi:hypothetical protein